MIAVETDKTWPTAALSPLDSVPWALPFDGMPIMLLLFYAIQWNTNSCTYCRSECHRHRMLDLMKMFSFGDTLDRGIRIQLHRNPWIVRAIFVVFARDVSACR